MVPHLHASLPVLPVQDQTDQQYEELAALRQSAASVCLCQCLSGLPPVRLSASSSRHVHSGQGARSHPPENKERWASLKQLAADNTWRQRISPYRDIRICRVLSLIDLFYDIGWFSSAVHGLSFWISWLFGNSWPQTTLGANRGLRQEFGGRVHRFW